MDLRSLLGIPDVFRLFDAMLGGRQCRKRFVRDYISIQPEQRLLDIGCGTADLLSDLQGVRYVGIDSSRRYIESARKRYGASATFYCGSLADIPAHELGTFDHVVAKGVLHHLNDPTAAKLFELARGVLSPGGQLTTFDGCKTNDLHLVAHCLHKLDRGKFIRTQEAYLSLAGKMFSRVTPHLHNDFLHVPYSHIVMECRV